MWGYCDIKEHCHIVSVCSFLLHQCSPHSWVWSKALPYINGAYCSMGGTSTKHLHVLPFFVTASCFWPLMLQQTLHPHFQAETSRCGKYGCTEALCRSSQHPYQGSLWQHAAVSTLELLCYMNVLSCQPRTCIFLNTLTSMECLTTGLWFMKSLWKARNCFLILVNMLRCEINVKF